MRKLMVVALALACAGCAAQRPMAWARADGKPFAADTLSLNQTICQGERQKANLSSHPTESIAGNLYKLDHLDDVTAGCMAEHGFVKVPADVAPGG